MTITVTALGANITTGAASASIAIPNDSSGVVARTIRVAVTSAAHIKLGTSGVTAVAADMLVQPADSIVLDVPVGLTHIAAIQDTAAGVANVAPVESVRC